MKALAAIAIMSDKQENAPPPTNKENTPDTSPEVASQVLAIVE
jgi:hypothetical protein